MQDREPTWPLECARNVHSQMGEDGVAEALLAMLPERNNWVVEFGAWDGLHLSNSRYFIQDKGFSGVLIEGSADRFEELQRLYSLNTDVHTVHKFVQTSGDDTLDAILARTPIPEDFDYLSIDIDGNDFHIWASLREFRPKLVCIEYNPTVASDVVFAQPDDFRLKQGAGIRSLVMLGKSRGYELAAVTTANAFFVPAEMFPALGITDNSIATLRRDTSHVTHIFSGYDGTVFVVGSQELPWHRIPMRFAGRQELPRFLRKFPLDYGAVRRTLFYALYAVRFPKTLIGKLSSRRRRIGGLMFMVNWSKRC